jgi:hypothetical protein
MYQKNGRFHTASVKKNGTNVLPTAANHEATPLWPERVFRFAYFPLSNTADYRYHISKALAADRPAHGLQAGE